MPDEKHPATAEEWLKENVQAALVSYSRPNNLTDAERAERRRQSQTRCWSKNGTKYKSQQREARRFTRKILSIANELKESIDDSGAFTALVRRDPNGQLLLQTLYGNDVKLDSWLPTEITSMDARKDDAKLYDFPRFVTYYLPPEQWPFQDAQSLGALDPSRRPYLRDILPGAKERRLVSLHTHGDKATDGVGRRSQTILNQCYDHWAFVLEDLRLKDAKWWGDEQEFAATSDVHQRATDLWYIWIEVVEEAHRVLVPNRVTMRDLAMANAQELDGAGPGAEGEVRAEALLKELVGMDPPKTRKRARLDRDETEETTQNDLSQP